MSQSPEEGIVVRIDEVLRHLIPMYLRSRRQDLVQLEAALLVEDYQSILYVAHVLKGNGLAFGFERLSLLARELEKAALKQKAQLIRHLLAEIESYLDRVHVEFVPGSAEATMVGLSGGHGR